LGAEPLETSQSKTTAVPQFSKRQSLLQKGTASACVVILLAALDCLGAAGVAGAGEESAKPAAPEPAIKLIESKLAEARADLAEAGGQAALTNLPMGVPLQDISARRALLNRLVHALEQQLSNAAELETAKRRRTDTAREAQGWTRFAEPPPYSILLLDRLHEEIQGEQLQASSSEAALQKIDQLLEANRTALNGAEEKLRQLNEQLESTKDPAAEALLTWQRELERLRSRVAAATIGFLDSERRVRKETLEESRIHVSLLKRQLAIASAGAKFVQADLDKVIDRIERDGQELERELSEFQERASTGLATMEGARDELRRIQALPDAEPATAARAAEQVAVVEAQLEMARAAIRILRLMLESENAERTIWEMRFDLENKGSVNALRESKNRLETFSGRLEVWKEYQQQHFDLSSTQIELQEARIRNLSPGSDLLPLARERLAALRERDQLLLRLLRRITQAQRLSQRWEEGLRSAEARLPLSGRARDLFSDARSFLGKLWNFEILTAEDTITVEGQKITGKRSVTLGKIVMAILILCAGIWLTQLVSRLMQPVFVRRFKMESNQANLILRWLKALLIACFVIFSLVSVKIPLTVFAFAGGALAIGLGFGMQTLLKNFVSGLILLFERPFRVGDVLEVGGQRGIVTEIGLRASVLQLWDGIETLIPNSLLLENNVSNWTYSSRKVRFSVTVGVAYGSDTRRVIQLLGETAERHGVVEKEPKPQALFKEFSDSALTFELRYWVDVIRGNAAQVASDLRQMIAGAFAENGLVMAFPQRDLHLDSARPLAVEIVPSQDKPQGDDQAGDRRLRVGIQSSTQA
jgi:small-conductance mechanosensitive channel/predicted  nucleic acid-binding Zn-ribbon protein